MDILEMAMAAKMAGGGGTTSIIKTVNGVGPDENGNVTVEVPEGGGSGGGVTSWNDLEDRPFYSVAEETYLVEDKKYKSALDSDFGVYAINPGKDTYGVYETKPVTFTFDGVTRTHEPVSLVFMETPLTCYGNLGMFAAFGVSAPNTGEPYVIVRYSNAYLTIFTTDTARTEHTISLRGTKLVDYPLDIRYTDMVGIGAVVDEKVSSAIAEEATARSNEIREKAKPYILNVDDFFPNGLTSAFQNADNTSDLYNQFTIMMYNGGQVIIKFTPKGKKQIEVFGTVSDDSLYARYHIFADCGDGDSIYKVEVIVSYNRVSARCFKWKDNHGMYLYDTSGVFRINRSGNSVVLTEVTE